MTPSTRLTRLDFHTATHVPWPPHKHTASYCPAIEASTLTECESAPKALASCMKALASGAKNGSASEPASIGTAPPAIDAMVTSKPAFVKTVYGSASSLIQRPVGCSPIWPALVLTRRTFLAILCNLRAWLRCVASFSRDFL